MKQDLIHPAATIAASLLADSKGAMGLKQVHDYFLLVYRELERAQETIGKEDQEKGVLHPP